MTEDKQQAVSHFNEVVASLELTREFIQGFEKIGIEFAKEEKKRKKQEYFERQQNELSRFKEIFTIQVFGMSVFMFCGSLKLVVF